MTAFRLPIVVDVRRTDIQRRFFERYAAAKTASDVLAAVAAEQMDAPALIASEDCAPGAGWTYWLLYLKGYVEYREQNGVDQDNVYVRFFIDHYLPGPYDPGLRSELKDASSILARVGARFADLQRLLGPQRRCAADAQILPIRVLASNRHLDDLYDVYDAPSGVSVKAQAIDGWHRLFAARLGDVRTLPGVVRLDEPTWTSIP